MASSAADEARRVALAAERLRDLSALLADVIGAVDQPDAPTARDSGRVFAEGLQQKLARRRQLP